MGKTLDVSLIGLNAWDSGNSPSSKFCYRNPNQNESLPGSLNKTGKQNQLTFSGDSSEKIWVPILRVERAQTLPKPIRFWSMCSK